MAPRISVILGTSRPNFGAIKAWPERDHIRYTLESLSKQTFDDFEVIIADALWATPYRGPFIEGNRLNSNVAISQPIYHVPAISMWSAKKGLPAISHTRNTGITYASGEHLVFIDDCSWMPENALERYWDWYSRKAFANALHVRLMGDVEEGRDARFALLEGKRFTYHFDFNGYMSMSLGAALGVNGFDEAFDGSRQLEDGDLSWRLRNAGYRLVLDRELIIHEQVHSAAICRDGSEYAQSPRCNGTWIFMRRFNRPAEFQANRVDWTEEQRRQTRPCNYLQNRSTCGPINAKCNMWYGDEATSDKHKHDDLADEFMVAPVFDLAKRREEALAAKDTYRIA